MIQAATNEENKWGNRLKRGDFFVPLLSSYSCFCTLIGDKESTTKRHKTALFEVKRMVGVTELEPVTSTMSKDQLSLMKKS